MLTVVVALAEEHYWVIRLGLMVVCLCVQQMDFLFLSLVFYLKTEADFSFRNKVVLQFYDLDDGRSPKEQLRLLHCAIV
jgi:hypothetical protein